ncbi:serine/threonine-protein kinase RIO3 [Dendroctonus ponderosae]|uniref:serine/threonine-protein kinase RIO3 n=1 Tax=Dendroctonus ponderosae TaxID=77166 RepID=UPI002034EB08|nr:serine/threonine-protein kinase RIO3 [Dendroctonus ponderosae]KAH1025619.1 hypothetical protein HUJ05_010311 [Dendroctonus ponderosae]
MSSCPWANIKLPDPVRLDDIISEEIAKDLKAKEMKEFYHQSDVQQGEAGAFTNEFLVSNDIPVNSAKSSSDEKIESDAEIAHILQMQFNKEYDNLLAKREQKINGTSKVSISFDKYKISRQCDDDEFENDRCEVEDPQDRKDWDRFDSTLREVNSIPGRGWKETEKGKIVTKHDLVNNGRLNTLKLMEQFPPEFPTGDGEDIDMKLSNRTFNTLKKHANKEHIRRYRIQDKREQATTEFAVDQVTSHILYQLLLNQVIKTYNGTISVGKEAVVMHAVTNQDWVDTQEMLPKECAIKIFKSTLTEYKNRDKFIKDDHRFKDKYNNCKPTSSKALNAWAEKEMANLIRLKRAGLRCPDVVRLKKHVLVLSFIGQNNIAAPKLKDAVLDDADYVNAYEQIVDGMKLMYNKARLIHADLSEYNILWHEHMCYFIDVSQSVEPVHKNAFKFLYDDCKHITNFFSKKQIVPNILTTDELFNSIVGRSFTEMMDLERIRESTKIKPHSMNRADNQYYGFEANWERAKQKRKENTPNTNATEINELIDSSD